MFIDTLNSWNISLVKLGKKLIPIALKIYWV